VHLQKPPDPLQPVVERAAGPASSVEPEQIRDLPGAVRFSWVRVELPQRSRTKAASGDLRRRLAGCPAGLVVLVQNVDPLVVRIELNQQPYKRIREAVVSRSVRLPGRVEGQVSDVKLFVEVLEDASGELVEERLDLLVEHLRRLVQEERPDLRVDPDW
jgi:hypothetical protein